MIYFRYENDALKNGLNITVTNQAWYCYLFLKLRVPRVWWTRLRAWLQKRVRKMWSYYRKLFR